MLRLLDSELTGPQIADELYVSLNTLRTHTKRIFTKLDVKTRAAAVRRAHEHGLSRPSALVSLGSDVTSPVTSCGDAARPRSFPRFQVSPQHLPRTNPEGPRHDHHPEPPDPVGRPGRRRSRSHLHRRPDQPPAAERDVHPDHRRLRPRHAQGGDGRTGPGRHHGHVPEPGPQARAPRTHRLRGVRGRLPRHHVRHLRCRLRAARGGPIQSRFRQRRHRCQHRPRHRARRHRRARRR